MKVSKNNASNNKVRKYYLSIEGHGSEMVLGTVSDRFSKFWVGKPTRSLSSYVFSEESERPQIANDLEMVGPWHENDNLGHAHGPYTLGATYVLADEDGSKLFKLGGHEAVDYLNVVDLCDVRSKKARKDSAVLRMQEHQKNEIDYVIRTNAPFDISRLTVQQDVLDGLGMINSVSYDGEVLEWTDWVTYDGNRSALLFPRKEAKLKAA